MGARASKTKGSTDSDEEQDADRATTSEEEATETPEAVEPALPERRGRSSARNRRPEDAARIDKPVPKRPRSDAEKLDRKEPKKPAKSRKEAKTKDKSDKKNHDLKEKETKGHKERRTGASSSRGKPPPPRSPTSPASASSSGDSDSDEDGRRPPKDPRKRLAVELDAQTKAVLDSGPAAFTPTPPDMFEDKSLEYSIDPDIKAGSPLHCFSSLS